MFTLWLVFIYGLLPCSSRSSSLVSNPVHSCLKIWSPNPAHFGLLLQSSSMVSNPIYPGLHLRSSGCYPGLRPFLFWSSSLGFFYGIQLCSFWSSSLVSNPLYPRSSPKVFNPIHPALHLWSPILFILGLQTLAVISGLLLCSSCSSSLFSKSGHAWSSSSSPPRTAYLVSQEEIFFLTRLPQHV